MASHPQLSRVLSLEAFVRIRDFYSLCSSGIRIQCQTAQPHSSLAVPVCQNRARATPQYSRPPTPTGAVIRTYPSPPCASRMKYGTGSRSRVTRDPPRPGRELCAPRRSGERAYAARTDARLAPLCEDGTGSHRGSMMVTTKRQRRHRDDTEGVREVTPAEGMALLDAEARRYLGMSGEEFLRAWHAGEIDPEEPERHSAVIRVMMLIPLAQPPTPV